MIFSYLLNMQSHPSWVCGLKLKVMLSSLIAFASHPSWVCGLKPQAEENDTWNLTSHPSWVCGLKLLVMIKPNKAQSHTLRGCVD